MPQVQDIQRLVERHGRLTNLLRNVQGRRNKLSSILKDLQDEISIVAAERDRLAGKIAELAASSYQHGVEQGRVQIQVPTPEDPSAIVQGAFDQATAENWREIDARYVEGPWGRGA